MVIVRPMAVKAMLTRRWLGLTTGAVWVLSAIVNAPYYATAKYWVQHQSCSRQFQVPTSLPSSHFSVEGGERLKGFALSDKTLYTLSFLLWYLGPVAILLCLYSCIGRSLWQSTTSGAAASSIACYFSSMFSLPSLWLPPFTQPPWPGLAQERGGGGRERERAGEQQPPRPLHLRRGGEELHLPVDGGGRTQGECSQRCLLALSPPVGVTQLLPPTAPVAKMGRELG